MKFFNKDFFLLKLKNLTGFKLFNELSLNKRFLKISFSDDGKMKNEKIGKIKKKKSENEF